MRSANSPCTGYIIAVALQMAVHREAGGCLRGDLNYYDMLRAVVSGIAREVQNNRPVHMRVATEDALAKWAKSDCEK
jgi:hypothetical protein